MKADFVQCRQELYIAPVAAILFSLELLPAVVQILCKFSKYEYLAVAPKHSLGKFVLFKSEYM